jgi:hypothetical protein
MNGMKLAAGLALGFSTLACGMNGTDVDGMPALTAEELAVVENAKRNTLAEIELPDGKMTLVEFAPGQVSISRQFRIGAKVTRLEGEDDMTLEQIFRAYAPGREVPRRLMDAMAREAEREQIPAPGATQPASPGVMDQGTPVEAAKPATSPDSIELVTSELASSVDQAWFLKTFCNVSASWSWCNAVAGRGAYASKGSHRSKAVTCGDTGAARMNFYVNGVLNTVLEVPYGTCWWSSYHHSHDIFGGSNRTTLLYSVPYAQSTVRFAGFMVDGDGFYRGF